MKDEDEGLSVADLSYICDLVYKEAAIVLDDAKSYLIEARLEPLARREGFDSRRDLVECLRTAKNPGLIAKTVDAMTTNETSFFRDLHPFLALRKLVLPEIIERKAEQKRLNIWCAAASTGEEPYTIAIIASEAMKGQIGDIKILATDISTRVLQQCRDGTYKADKLETVPPQILRTYFEQVSGENGTNLYRATNALKSIVSFSRLNLSVTPFPMKGPMDIIFIRNVMIYFDDELRKRLLAEAHRLLKPDGYLIVGHAEGLTGLVSNFMMVRSSVYQRG